MQFRLLRLHLERLGDIVAAAPEFAEGEEDGLAERYASLEWMELR